MEEFLLNFESSNSSSEVKTEGNTKTSVKKQISPAIRWCFTLNNYTITDCSSIVLTLKDNCRKAVVGKEVGESGTPHLQGYFELKKKGRPVGIFKNEKIHFEKAKGDDIANDDYCSKDKNILIRFGYPEPVRCIDREDFYDWQEEIVKIFEVPCKWNCRKIYWRYGKAGIGKTQFCKWLCLKLGAIVIGGTGKHMLAQVQNAKAGIYIVLLSYGDDDVCYRAIEKIKDGLFTSCFGCDNNKMEIRNAPHILIIGNEPPNTSNENFHPDKYDVKLIG